MIKDETGIKLISYKQYDDCENKWNWSTTQFDEWFAIGIGRVNLSLNK